jgi:hypothetical protein
LIEPTFQKDFIEYCLALLFSRMANGQGNQFWAFVTFGDVKNDSMY